MTARHLSIETRVPGGGSSGRRSTRSNGSRMRDSERADAAGGFTQERGLVAAGLVSLRAEGVDEIGGHTGDPWLGADHLFQRRPFAL